MSGSGYSRSGMSGSGYGESGYGDPIIDVAPEFGQPPKRSRCCCVCTLLTGILVLFAVIFSVWYWDLLDLYGDGDKNQAGENGELVGKVPGADTQVSGNPGPATASGTTSATATQAWWNPTPLSNTIVGSVGVLTVTTLVCWLMGWNPVMSFLNLFRSKEVVATEKKNEDIKKTERVFLDNIQKQMDNDKELFDKKQELKKLKPTTTEKVLEGTGVAAALEAVGVKETKEVDPQVEAENKKNAELLEKEIAELEEKQTAIYDATFESERELREKEDNAMNDDELAYTYEDHCLDISDMHALEDDEQNGYLGAFRRGNGENMPKTYMKMHDNDADTCVNEMLKNRFVVRPDLDSEQDRLRLERTVCGGKARWGDAYEIKKRITDLCEVNPWEEPVPKNGADQ